MEALNERIRGIQQAQETWEMLKAQQAEELRLMRDSEALRNDEFAVLLRQENERRAELDSKFAASETRRMLLERERIEISARCDSLTQQVKSSESQIDRMRAQFSEQLQSALSEAASREARVAAPVCSTSETPRSVLVVGCFVASLCRGVELTLACAQVRKLQRMQAQHASALEQASETIMSSIKGFPSSHLTAFPDEVSKLSGSFRNSA
jgi:hypothetical protein